MTVGKKGKNQQIKLVVGDYVIIPNFDASIFSLSMREELGCSGDEGRVMSCNRDKNKIFHRRISKLFIDFTGYKKCLNDI